ncbi:MAG: type II secretion system F family protein [Myxococcota bacterium]|nr:type II secretion system F family protein [Myxococcota bacterium]MDW8363779.1 type II secretion system F family protein [Myxococcales bacterium]
MTPTQAIGWAGIACVVLGLLIGTYTAAKTPPVEAPRTGNRGVKRRAALAAGGLFASIEPLVRLVAAWMSRLPLHGLRRRFDQQLVHGGDWLGLSADELLALCVLSAAAMGAVGLVGAHLLEMGPIVAVLFAGIGATLPTTRLSGEIQDRFKAINRSLPAAIDLVALCMGAGLDFPGSLRQYVDKAPRKDHPLVEEFGRILQELEVGRTRRQALESFSVRAPTEAVRDFVGAVVQAEEKGNPLAEVLRIQAGMLRMRRSVAAEENAARAGVMMMGPLMLIFAAIVLLLLGPFILRGMKSGF